LRCNAQGIPSSADSYQAADALHIVEIVVAWHVCEKAVVRRGDELDAEVGESFQDPAPLAAQFPPGFDRPIPAATDENDPRLAVDIEGGLDVGARLVTKTMIAAAIEFMKRQGDHGNVEQGGAAITMENERNVDGQLGRQARRRPRDVREIEPIDLVVPLDIMLNVARADIVAAGRVATAIAEAVVVALLLVNCAAQAAVGAADAAERHAVPVGVVPPAALAPEIAALLSAGAGFG
jgi:hypothetical protein